MTSVLLMLESGYRISQKMSRALARNCLSHLELEEGGRGTGWVLEQKLALCETSV